MVFTIHAQILSAVFVIAAILGAVMNKTHFCTMGSVSDLVNIGDATRMRSWLFAIAVAIAGTVALEAGGVLDLSETFPPYRTAQFAWVRYVLGGLMFGVGMTLASGCGSKTFLRIGAGNMKSLVLLVFFAAPAAYLMMWTNFFNVAFMSWMAPTAVNLQAYGIATQELGAVLGGVTGVAGARALHYVLAAAIVLALLVYIFRSPKFRRSPDAVAGGAVVGLAVIAGWWVTGGPRGRAWMDFVAFDMTADPPSRVAVQSYTFVSPMGDSLRYLLEPANLALLNFGVMALAGVIVGSFVYAVASRTFRIEWFASFKDFVAHAAGGILMGIGGVLALGCTIGQGITGVSTLALGSLLALAAMIFGSALTMKIQYHMLDEQGFVRALRLGLADLRLLPGSR